MPVSERHPFAHRFRGGGSQRINEDRAQFFLDAEPLLAHQPARCTCPEGKCVRTGEEVVHVQIAWIPVRRGLHWRDPADWEGDLVVDLVREPDTARAQFVLCRHHGPRGLEREELARAETVSAACELVTTKLAELRTNGFRVQAALTEDELLDMLAVAAIGARQNARKRPARRAPAR